mgnify:CR=1 FL=1
MDEWPVQCFKAYDIRGLSNGNGTGELTPKFAYRLGSAMATYLGCDAFAVGRDIRDSSPALTRELMRGLVEGGVEVHDLGIVSTGCVYHACWTLPVDGGVMVTASHLPMPTHNGFKMCKGTLPLAGEEIQELKDVFLKGIQIRRRSNSRCASLGHLHRCDYGIDGINCSSSQGRRRLWQRCTRTCHVHVARQDGC